jgi:hypothetical protein
MHGQNRSGTARMHRRCDWTIVSADEPEKNVDSGKEFENEVWITCAGSQSVRKYFHRLHYLAVAFCLASLLFPVGLGAQAPTYSPQDVDSGKVQPLDLKPGCWQVRTVVVMDMTGLYKQTLWAQIKAIQKMDNLTPEKRAQMVAGLEADERKAEKQSGKNVDDRTSIACTVAPFFDAGREIYGTVAQQCAKTVQVSGETRHIHIACPVVNGDQITDDYDRMDAGYFKGAREKVTASSETGPNGEHLTTTNAWTWIGKWIGEAAPHKPNGFVDVNGMKPKGPQAVASVDGFRIVAEVDGNKIIAQTAYIWLNKVPVRMIASYGPRLSVALQYIIMHEAIAGEAEKLNLDSQEPWKSQLFQQGGATREFRATTGGLNSISDVGLDDLVAQEQMVSEAFDAREKILWNAYFSQAKTEAEKQALLQKVQEKYKLTVTDPDFFNGETSP